MRIRTIKPEFWRSESIKRLDRELRLLFIGLWSYVDDNGVGIDDYRQVAADLFPLEDDPTEVRNYVRDGLAALSRESRIIRYHVSGKHYLAIVGWQEHQRIDRPGKKRYPEPGDEGVVLTSDDADPREPLASASGESRERLAPGTGEQGNRGTGERGARQAINSRAAGREPRPALDEISGTAHSPAAHRHVQDYAQTCAKRPPASVLRRLGAGVDELLAADYEPDQITAALAEWGSKGIGAQHLPAIAHEMVNRKLRVVAGQEDWRRYSEQ